MLVENQLVTDDFVKAYLFNDYFSQQCMIIDNDSSIPPNIAFQTEQKRSTFEFCTDEIIKIIKSLDSNNVHGWNIYSNDKIMCFFSNFCQNSLETVLKMNVFPKNGRKPVLYLFIKNDKQLVKNYRPALFCMFVVKYLKKLYFTHFFKYLDDNNLLSGNYLGFGQGDFCVHHLLSITYEIYLEFDANPSLEVREVFPELSKGFD